MTEHWYFRDAHGKKFQLPKTVQFLAEDENDVFKGNGRCMKDRWYCRGNEPHERLFPMTMQSLELEEDDLVFNDFAKKNHHWYFVHVGVENNTKLRLPNTMLFLGLEKYAEVENRPRDRLFFKDADDKKFRLPETMQYLSTEAGDVDREKLSGHENDWYLMDAVGKMFKLPSTMPFQQKNRNGDVVNNEGPGGINNWYLINGGGNKFRLRKNNEVGPNLQNGWFFVNADGNMFKLPETMNFMGTENGAVVVAGMNKSYLDNKGGPCFFKETICKSKVSIVGGKIENKIHFRAAQLAVFVLTLLISIAATFIFSWEDTYDYSSVKGVVTTKVAGSLWAGTTLDTDKNRTWDVEDIVIPPRGPDEFFIMTHVEHPLKQEQGACEANPDIEGIRCQTDADCMAKEGMILKGSQGPITGLCIPSTFVANVSVCQIFAWCPISYNEWQKDKGTTLYDTRNWTVLILNNIEFPLFRKKWYNYKNMSTIYDDDLDIPYCLHDNSTTDNKFCPIFTLETIVEKNGDKYEDVAREGGIFRIVIRWDCNMRDMDNCSPEYDFTRMDGETGYDIRYLWKRGNGTRELVQAYGIRFLVNVEGSGKMFAWDNLIRAIGSFLSIVSPVILFVIYGIVLSIFCGYTQVDTYIKQPKNDEKIGCCRCSKMWKSFCSNLKWCCCTCACLHCRTCCGNNPPRNGYIQVN